MWGLARSNFCFQALVEKGLVKMQNFSQSKALCLFADPGGGGREIQADGGVFEAQSS